MLNAPIVSQLCEQRISRTNKSLNINFTGFSHYDIFFASVAKFLFLSCFVDVLIHALVQLNKVVTLS